MSRHIEYEPLMAELEREVELADDWKTAHEIANVAKYAPSIDIVRCKECKHWHREIGENGVEYVNFSKCTKGHYGNGLDFYCSDGEREGE